METAKLALLQKYPTQVPRYTSYPAAPHFTAMTGETQREWLENIPPAAEVSLYLHIPYCQKLCWFCGCHTLITQKYRPVEAYLGLLEKEIKQVAAVLGRKQSVAHVHFGGGSPTILQSDDFLRIMELLRAHFAIGANAEIAVEIDPRTTNEAKIASYARQGVNRISVGVQDFNASVQAAINRIQPFSCVYDAVRLCHDYGIDNISFDLIYGLPKQTLESFAGTVERALMLNPQRLALFGYAHVPWKKKNMRLIDESALPGEELRLAMFAHAEACLREAGYIPVGLDHFVKPGDAMALALEKRQLRRNFQGYTTDPSDILIGLGASAISSLPQGYVQNITNVEEYKNAIGKGELVAVRGFSLTEEDRLRRDIIEQLMCYFEVDVAKLCRAYAVPVSHFDMVFNHLLPMEKDGLLQVRNGTEIQVDRALPQAVRLVCAMFDAYFAPLANQHAQVA